MKLAEFDRLTRESLSEPLESGLGFSFKNGTFWRDLESGVRSAIIIDFDTRTKKTFRVILGFNAVQIAGNRSPDEAGVYAVRYLAQRAVSSSPTNFLCMDSSTAVKSLSTVKLALLEFALPMFDSVKTLAELAAVVEDQYPAVKGQLLLHAGARDEAKVWLTKHQTYLRAHRYTETDPAWIETQKLLLQCER